MSTALLTSLGLHGVTIALGATLLAHALPGGDSPEAGELIRVEVASPGIELPAMHLGGARDRASTDEAPRADPPSPPPPGARHTPRPDLRRAPGRGGDEASRSAQNLADQVDGVTLSASALNNLDQSQAHRLRTSRQRQTRDDRRATPNPMDLSFLASGQGTLQERRPPAASNPARGSLSATVPRRQGPAKGQSPRRDPGAGPPSGAPDPGAERTAAAAGVRSGRTGDDVRRSARVALARPAVRRARAAVPTTHRGRPSDTADSTQEVSTAIQSLISASHAGGVEREGPGGEPSSGDPGWGGRAGPGGLSRPNGAGRGAADSTLDPGIDSYAAGVTRQVYPYWENAFPDWALSEGIGGVAVIGVTIRGDGSVASVDLVRKSGVSEFDRNVALAVRRAAPFRPLPSALRSTGLRLNIAFDAINPAVGRSGPGPGRSLAGP